MEAKTPLLRNQVSSEVYREALELARIYCPELTGLNKHLDSDYFDAEDPALVILKLFSEMTEFLLTQTNKIPEKYRLAFMDFIGMELLPPNPAKVPLTFSLSEGSSGACVPAGTTVASSTNPSVVFETFQDLSVVATGLSSVFSVNPWEDKYTKHKEALSGKEDGFYIFGGDTLEKKNDHILYLGDDEFLDIRREATVKINVTGKNLSKEYFGYWVDLDNNPIKVIEIIPENSPTNITISLSVPKLNKKSVNGISNFWLAVKPDVQIVKGSNSVLPEIEKITADINVKEIIPDAVFFNNLPMDPKKGFYPFGEEPKVGDTLYIGSEEAFSKKDAIISFTIKAVDKTSAKDVILSWEYWNGSEWNTLSVLAKPDEDSVISFQKSGSIEFTCPLIPITEINGQLNRWIRVRLEFKNYGTAGRIEQKDKRDVANKLVITLRITDLNAEKMVSAFDSNRIAFGFEYKTADFDPPFIKAVNISYNYTNRDFSRKKMYNNFHFQDYNIGSPLGPFISCKGTPTLYLGFKENITDAPLTLFFAVKEQLYNEKQKILLEDRNSSPQNQGSDAISLTWECTGADDKWIAFGVEDETESFRKGGIVSFLVPSEIHKRFEFGQELYWIRARVNDSKRIACSKLRGIFPNTVWALNNVTVENEILGSGNGEPGLSLFFSKKPILEGQIIEVNEPIIPSNDELKIIEDESGSEVVRIEKEAGEIKEVWVIWNETRDFTLSNSLSRHYMLDRANGEITFGDGINGMIPPRGKNNIVARQYKSGGGEKGDMVAGVITSLKTTIPNIESVTNKVSSSGGMDQEDLENAINRGPYTLKNGGRAVTKEDFEQLSYEASQYVARARCIVENGEIKVIVVPRFEGDTPLPEAGFLDLIRTYLKEKTLITIADRISVQGPEYATIDAEVKFKPTSLTQSKIVADRIVERVKRFLHPLKGGQNEEGWDFGQDIFISEMAAVIEGLEGVNYVTEIYLKKGEKSISGVDRMQIVANSLPSAGSVIVKPEEE